jgi:hypothetical protein
MIEAIYLLQPERAEPSLLVTRQKRLELNDHAVLQMEDQPTGGF